MITPEQEQALLDAAALGIDDDVREAYREVVRRIEEGEPPRVAIAAVMATFAGAYAQTLARGFSAILALSIGTESVLAMRVGDMSLSARLYAESQQVSAVVQNIVSRHAAGFHDARALTLQLFEGYGFRADEPLKINPRNPRLPKYLRSELLKDPGLAGDLSRHFATVQAGKLKTPALRAAYLEYLDALEQGKGQQVLNRKMEVAFNERVRHFANRIAQTELHRAYADRQAVEIMEDEDAVFVQIRMSRTHPKTDVCDYFASVDRYGLGNGVYPKHLAPKPGFHPYCRCIAALRLDIDPGTKWRERPEAGQAWLRAQGLNEGAAVMGSRARRDRVLKGEDPLAVWNERSKPMYQVKTVGEVSRDGWALQQFGGYPAAAVRSPASSATLGKVKTAYEIAKEGGKNRGLYVTHSRLSTDEVKRSIRSFERQIQKHEGWIASPITKTDLFYTFDVRRQDALIVGWKQDIERHRESIEIMRGILKERGNG